MFFNVPSCCMYENNKWYQIDLWVEQIRRKAILKFWNLLCLTYETTRFYLNSGTKMLECQRIILNKDFLMLDLSLQVKNQGPFILNVPKSRSQGHHFNNLHWSSVSISGITMNVCMEWTMKVMIHYRINMLINMAVLLFWRMNLKSAKWLFWVRLFDESFN